MLIDRAAIVIQADRFDMMRCRCPVCIALDARHPGEGFQMALFPYRPVARTMRLPDPSRRVPAMKDTK